MLRCFLFVLLFASTARPVVSKLYVHRSGRESSSPSLIQLSASLIDTKGPVGNGVEQIRVRRADNSKLVVNVTNLLDESHNEAIVHWSGQKSQVMFVLTRAVNENGTTVNSTLYQSVDYGSSFQNIQSRFPGSGIVIHYYYVCPGNKDKLVFVDLKQSTLYFTVNEGSTFNKSVLTFTPDRLLFHPKQENHLLAYSDKQRQLRVSVDFGNTWSLIHDMVNPRFYWADPDVDADPSTIHMECEDPITGRFRYHAVKQPYPTEVEIDPDLGYIDIGSVVVQSEYIFVQKTTPFSSHLYVSYMRQPFKQAHFPNNAHPADFAVVEANEHQVFIAASHLGGTVTLYLSDTTGQFYTKSLDHVVAFSRADNFILDLYEVRGLLGTYIANQHGPTGSLPRTLITFNQGGNWRPIPAPDVDFDNVATNCKLPNCSLYLHLQIDPLMYAIPMPLSDDNAPGMILAQGVIGSRRDTIFVMSRDGGLTWSAVMNGSYQKSILDQGGGIVVTPISGSDTDATKILYSCTEGKTWQTYDLTMNKMKVDGLLNEPGINSLVTSIYGHTTSKDSDLKPGWIIVKLNFSQILSQQCQPSDYYTWIPTSGLTSQSCLLGQKMTFEKRKPDSECFNGEDYDRAINITSCVCQREDFECDFGYELRGDDCVVAPWFDASMPVIRCEAGETFMNSTGYRMVAADNCTDDKNTSKKFDPVSAVCPVIKPLALGIEVFGGNVVSVNTNVTFHLIQELGSRNVTIYSWDFGDGSTILPVTGFVNAQHQVHVYKATGFYTIQVTASNSMGSETASIKIWIQDKLSGLYVTVSHAVQVNKAATFQVVPLLLHSDLQDGSLAPDTENIHYFWLFGDEGSGEKGELSWSSSVTHTYAQPANYTIWVEAFTGVGSVFRTVTIPVYGTVVTVQLVLSGLRLPFGLVDTVFEDILATSLHKVLTFELGIDETRLDVEFDQMTSPVAYVSVLPEQQTWMSDPSIDEIVNQLLNLAEKKSIHFTLPDEAFGSNDVITVVKGSIVSDGSSIRGRMNKIGLAVGVPVLVMIFISCVMLLVYYKKRMRSTRHYSVLHSRYRDGNTESGTSLLDDTDDDEPLVDPTNLESNAQQRLALSDDDDDPLCARIIMSETGGRELDTQPANC